MISGYIENGKITCISDYKIIDNKDILLVIDGELDSSYYQEIIKEYQTKKYDFIKEIKDFISIYLFDKKTKELLIINDRMGAKKVYYYQNNNILYFSNDINKVIKSKKINQDTLSMYFRFHFIPEPFTIYQDVYKLEHGYYLTYSNNKIDKYNYWNLIEIFNKRELKSNYNKIEKELDNKLKNKIKELTNNKKNVGVYLSSGIDSSLASSMYNEISKEKINTFSIGFEQQEINEATSSKKIANYLKTNHHEFIIKDEDALKCVKKIPEYYCEPFGDPSAVSTLILNEFAKGNNIKYALTGDGSDQLFCGANIYDTLYKKQHVNPLNIHLSSKLLKTRKMYYTFSNIPKKYRAQLDIIYEEKKLDSLFKDDGPKRFEYELDIKTKNLQEKRMILDLNTFMVERVFPKMCLAAKKNDINIISPYLTHEIIEYSFSIPHRYKYHNRIKKYILKNILYKYLPKEFFLKKKTGFAIPTVYWLKNELNEDLKKYSTKKYLEKQNIFNYDKVQYIINHIDENANIVWDYYIFQLWYNKYITNRKE